MDKLPSPQQETPETHTQETIPQELCVSLNILATARIRSTVPLGTLSPEGLTTYKQNPQRFLQRFINTRPLAERRPGFCMGVFPDGTIHIWKQKQTRDYRNFENKYSHIICNF